MIEQAEHNFDHEIYTQKRLKLMNLNYAHIAHNSPRDFFRGKRMISQKYFDSIFLDLGFNSYQLED